MWDDYFGDRHEEPTSYTDTALVCLNGHVINHSFKKYPIHNKKFCPKCGEPTITNCLECKAEIAGAIHYSNVIGAIDYNLPAFCSECGKPYPWTITRLKAAKELASELEELTLDEQKTLEKSIDEIAKNNPQATVGATRIKKIMNKVGSATGETLQKIIVDIASETAKKILLGK